MELNYWDNDCENNDKTEFYANTQETIKNRERELKILEERRLIKEADNALVNDLFKDVEVKCVTVNIKPNKLNVSNKTHKKE